MVTKRQSAVQFFYEHAGYSYGPGETPEQGRRRCARQLANAERWLSEQPGFQVKWIVDLDYRADDYDCDMPSNGWGCIISVPGGEQSLWGITFDSDDGLNEPWGHAYARVVVAELALELMP